MDRRNLCWTMATSVIPATTQIPSTLPELDAEDTLRGHFAESLAFSRPVAWGPAGWRSRSPPTLWKTRTKLMDRRTALDRRNLCETTDPPIPWTAKLKDRRRPTDQHSVCKTTATAVMSALT